MNDDEQMRLTRLEQLLEENMEISQETNSIVRDLRRTTRWAFAIKLVLWAAVIILPFLLLKPIIETLVPAAGSGSGFLGFPSQENIERAIESYQGQ